jgi:hypothetical protein
MNTTVSSPNADGGRMGGATARSVWYSMTIEPEGSFGIGVLYGLSML